MRIPGFKIKRTIGRGGMATVYLAEQESLERDVVLKVMNTGQTDSRDFTERFLNEGRIVAALRHPHIITIFDIGHAGELVYIAMEYVEGGDLKSRIGEPMAPERALGIVADIASALEFAHQRGVIHRDVKPANILFRDDGTVLLSDFGIAKQITVDSELTSTGTILGSPFYMSPEQAEGMVVDGRTDIYSLGVILFEMLTGERPYQGDSAIKVIMKHIQSPIPRLPESLAQFQPLVERVMAKDREERVPDATELLREIGAELERLAGRRAPPAPAEARAGGEARRHGPRARTVALLSTLAALLVGLGAFYAYTRTLEPSSIVPPRPSAPEPAAVPGASIAEQAGLGRDAGPGAPQTGQGVDVEDVTRALEWLARNSLREDRLTQPPADNAYYYYSRLLALDPDNEVARKGFNEIAERFVVLAEKEFSRRNYSKAQAYIALGLQVDPDNEGLLALQGFIENRKKSFFEALLDMLRS